VSFAIKKFEQAITMDNRLDLGFPGEKIIAIQFGRNWDSDLND
jgi:hypothetical protein